MPRISEFFGITIAMHYNDHAPPHFNAKYGEYEATVAIDTLELLSGALPNRVLGLALEWGRAAPPGAAGQLGGGTTR